MVARHMHHNRGNKLQRFAYNLATLPGLPWCASRLSGILYSALAGGGRREAGGVHQYPPIPRGLKRVFRLLSEFTHHYLIKA